MKPARPRRDPRRPLGGAAHLREERIRPLLRAGLQRRARPPLPDRPVGKQGRELEPITQRFVDGINAYVDWTGKNAAALPWEFGHLGYKPAKWTAEDAIRIRSHGLTRNLNSEVARAKTLCATKDVEMDDIV